MKFIVNAQTDFSKCVFIDEGAIKFDETKRKGNTWMVKEDGLKPEFKEENDKLGVDYDLGCISASGPKFSSIAE